MINFINRFILLFTEKDCYGNKLYNNNENNFDINKHYEIIKKVRNYITLDNSEIDFIKTLPLKDVLDIVEILNIHTERVTEIFNNMLE
jgi:hypothetical protein